MSDTTQGPGWWLASDGKWYPPQPAYLPPPPPQQINVVQRVNVNVGRGYRRRRGLVWWSCWGWYGWMFGYGWLWGRY